MMDSFSYILRLKSCKSNFFPCFRLTSDDVVDITEMTSNVNKSVVVIIYLSDTCLYKHTYKANI